MEWQSVKIKKIKFTKPAFLKRKKKRLQTLSFHFGEQDLHDIISYGGLEEQKSFLCIDDRYVRTLFISGYPIIATTGWLNMLINFNHNIDISYHIDQVEAQSALPQLIRKITELDSTKRHMIETGQILGPEVLDPLESATVLRDKIYRGQEKLFQVSLYITVTADSLLTLNKTTTLLETALSTKLFYTKTAMFRQIEGLQSVLPRSENLLMQRRNLNSSSAALTFPFVSSELAQESGILYGINKSNNSLSVVAC